MTRPTSDDVTELLDLYKTGPEEKAALLDLVRDARQRGWWAKYSDVLGSGTYTGLEAEASRLRSYDCLLIPGLLQTPDYAEAIMRVGLIKDEEEIQRRLEARRARQAVLNRDDAPVIEAVIDEAALHRLVGGASVMRDQLLRLIEANKQPSIDVRILPNSSGAHQAMTGQFVIIDFPEEEDTPAVFIESAHNGLFLEESEEIESYSLIYDSARSAALDVEKSNALMTELIDRLLE